MWNLFLNKKKIQFLTIVVSQGMLSGKIVPDWWSTLPSPPFVIPGLVLSGGLWRERMFVSFPVTVWGCHATP